MTEPRGLLFVRLDIPEEDKEAWDKWYNGVHIPDRMNLPGFLFAGRYTIVPGLPREYHTEGDSAYVALYDLENSKVLQDAPYQAVREKDLAQPPDSFEYRIFRLPRFGRGVYQQIYPQNSAYKKLTSEYVFLVGHDVPADKDEEFNAWYDTEHTPALMSVPGFLTVRRYKMDPDDPPTTDKGGILSQYLTIWELSAPEVLESEAFINAARSPWSDRVRAFYKRQICTLYKRIYPED